MAEEFKQDPLPYSLPQQQAFLAYMVEDPRLFKMVYDVIKSDWFADPWCKRVYEIMLKFEKRFNKPPTLQELLAEADNDPNGNRSALVAAINNFGMRMQTFTLLPLRVQLTDWLRSNTYRRGVLESNMLFGQHKTPEAYARIKKMNIDIEHANFEGTSDRVDWNDRTVFERKKKELENALTFGLSAFDKIITPEADHGSLLRGDSTILLSPTNIGKTLAMITIAVANVKRGKKVLFVSHEGNEVDLREKMWMAVLERSKGDLYRLLYPTPGMSGGYDLPENQVKLDIALRFLNQGLVYMPMHRAGLTVEEVTGNLRRVLEREIAETGVGFDMVVDDYLAKLTTTRGDHWQRRQVDEAVYSDAFRIGEEFNLHFLTAIQANREGSKVMNHMHGEDRLLRQEDVLESWGPMTAATNIISINRDSIAEAQGRVTFLQCKSRSAEKGWAICCKSDYARGRTHGDELGCTWYRGDCTMSANIDHYLATYFNREIPGHIAQMANG